MKKTAKDGLGHHTKLEKVSKRLAADRAAIALREEVGKKAIKARRYCG
jgi:hypothetical protein